MEMPIRDELADELSAFAKRQAPWGMDAAAEEEIDSLAGRAAQRLHELGQAEDPVAVAKTRDSLAQVIAATAPDPIEGAGLSRGPEVISALQIRLAVSGLCPGLYPIC